MRTARRREHCATPRASAQGGGDQRGARADSDRRPRAERQEQRECERRRDRDLVLAPPDRHPDRQQVAREREEREQCELDRGLAHAAPVTAAREEREGRQAGRRHGHYVGAEHAPNLHVCSWLLTEA
jgi:hypothetical protein